VPVAEIANARTGQQAVDITGALLEPLGRRPDEDEGLIGRHIDPQIESSAVRLTHNRELRSALRAKTSVVDGAVRTNGKRQPAAELPRHTAIENDAGTRTEADGGKDFQSAICVLHDRDSGRRPLATKNPAQPSQHSRHAKLRDGLSPRDSGCDRAGKRVKLAWIHCVLLSHASVAAAGTGCHAARSPAAIGAETWSA
jgi:hypothetical protein